jgi:16S rRNA (guanine527-N7)-methyltransferase
MIEETLVPFLMTNKWILSEEQKEKLLTFLLLVQKVNPHMNLVSNESDDELVYSHLQDSMQLMNCSWIPTTHQKWIDVGSGGGFPGIVAAILFPHFTFYLVESIRKKYSFLLYATIEATINNVHVIHDRAENVVNTQSIMHNCTVFSARGVGSVAYLSPFFDQSLSPEGKAVFWKDPKEVSSFLQPHSLWEIMEQKAYQSRTTEKHIVVLQRKVITKQGSGNARKSKKLCIARP